MGLAFQIAQENPEHEDRGGLPEWPEPEFDPNCKPMADWQSLFHPLCNEFHSLDMDESLMETELKLLSTKGYWRHVWLRMDGSDNHVPTIWKTTK